MIIEVPDLMSKKPFTDFPKIVRPLPDPLGLYLRAGHNDHKTLLNLLAMGKRAFCGVVFDPTKHDRHRELREQVLHNNLNAIFDPKTLRSSLPGVYTDALGSLPWGKGRQHNPDDFTGISGRRLIHAMAAYSCDNGFTQVMAPTHYIAAIDDPWLNIDIESTCRLRNFLDSNGAASVPIIYPLTIPYRVFRNADQRAGLIRILQQAPVSSVWLLIDGVGRNSTATAVQNYISAAREFHSLGIPIVADYMGGAIGLSLLASGAVGGMTHGVMLNEQLQASSWRRPKRNNSKYTSRRQIYVPAIDAMLPEKEAEILFSSRGAKSQFGCHDSSCCPRGIQDMVENHSRHFLYQRMAEVGRLSQIPETLRPQRFLEQHVRPATDKALAATRIDWDDEKITKKMYKKRKDLDTLRIALGDLARRNPPRSFSLHPKTRVSRANR